MNRPAMLIAAGAAVVCAIAAFLLFGGRSTPPPVTTVSSFGAAANDPAIAKTRQEIQAVQRRFQDAVRAKDMKTVLSLMTPDFIQVNLDGTRVNRKQAEEAMRQSWPHVQSIDKWSLEMAKFTVDGDSATGLVRERLVARIKVDGKVVTENSTGNSRNTWVRTPSGWKYKRMQEMPAGEGTLGDIDYMSGDEWVKEGQSRQAADRREANRQKDQAAAVKTGTAISKAEARRVLEQLYRDFRAAVRRKDADAALATLSEDYSAEYPNVVRPRMTVERETRRELKALQSIPEWTHDIGDITVDGNVVTARIRERRTAIYPDQAGKRHRVTMDVTMRDTWVRTRAGWKNTRTEMLSLTQTIDGRRQKVF